MSRSEQKTAIERARDDLTRVAFETLDNDSKVIMALALAREGRQYMIDISRRSIQCIADLSKQLAVFSEVDPDLATSLINELYGYVDAEVAFGKLCEEYVPTPSSK